jgi:hypothetical protein
VDEAAALAQGENHGARTAGEQLRRRPRLAARRDRVTEQELGLDLVRAQHIREAIQLGREARKRGRGVEDRRRRLLARDLERGRRDLEGDLELADEDACRGDRRSSPLDVVAADPFVRARDDDDRVLPVGGDCDRGDS